MDVIESLKQMRESVAAERAVACEKYDIQIADIDAAITTIVDRHISNPSKADIDAAVVRIQRGQKMSVDNAIVEAIRNGRRKPAAILDFIAQQLGMGTTINSVRTRLTKLKNDERISRDDRGWIMPDEVSEGLPLSENGETTDSPEANTGSAASTSGVLNLNPSPEGAQDARGNPNVDPNIIGMVGR